MRKYFLVFPAIAILLLFSCSNDAGKGLVPCEAPKIMIAEAAIGDHIDIDNTTGVIAYIAETPQEWGRYILAEEYDLNHYEPLLGSNEPGKIYYGKFWDHNDPQLGHTYLITGATDKGIGSGLKNTFQVIRTFLNDKIEPDIPADADLIKYRDYMAGENLWSCVVWHWEDVGDKWFIPSLDELYQLKINGDKIGNFTMNFAETAIYWSSTELKQDTAGAHKFYDDSEQHLGEFKNSMRRVRLCRYADDSEIGKTVTLSSDTPGAVIRYTLDGSSPDESSAIYTRPFIVPENAHIKAVAFADGMAASETAEQIVSAVTGE